jgi:phosphate uptake regulator
LSLISSTILSEATQALVEKNDTLAEEAIDREDEADMIYYLAVRLLLSAQGKPEIAEQLGFADLVFIPATRLILQYLELIADYSEDVARDVLSLKVYRNRVPADTVDRIKDLSELAQAIFQKAVDCIFTGDLKIANSLLEMNTVLELEANRFMHEAPEIPYLRAIVSTLTRIGDKGATIADIAVNRALERPSKEVENIIKTVKHTRTLPLPMKKK